jgi:uncharacterized protein (TIGR02757 family)
LSGYVNSIHAFCEEAYNAYTTRCYLHPDPLELVHGYEDAADRELVGFVCAGLSLGRVDLILGACRSVLERLPAPAESLAGMQYAELQELFQGFVYRFFRTDEISSFLFALGETLRTEGSLEELYLRCAGADDKTVIPGLEGLIRTLRSRCPADPGILLPDPAKGGATKRLHMFLRWMVREDELDLGVWKRVSAGQLLFPLDVHMFRVAATLGCTERKTISLRTAEEVTAYFRRFSPADPVKYDFALTRFGIHPEVKKRFGLVEQARSKW